MKAKVLLENGVSFDVQFVEPAGVVYTPSNTMVIEKRLTDAMHLNLPLPLGIRVLSKHQEEQVEEQAA